jgi:hypothetical protein
MNREKHAKTRLNKLCAIFTKKEPNPPSPGPEIRLFCPIRLNFPLEKSQFEAIFNKRRGFLKKTVATKALVKYIPRSVSLAGKFGKR